LDAIMSSTLLRNRLLQNIRKSFSLGESSIGTWMQIPNSSIAEILGAAGYDWVAVDLEHGSISLSQLPDFFRAIELGGSLPLARLSGNEPNLCKRVLDAGAGGVIIPMIENRYQLEAIRDAMRWPPAGKRGVGFSRANLFGKYFQEYSQEAQSPLLVAMIENINAFKDLQGILTVKGLDAILIGPYDLSASMGKTGQFNDPQFIDLISNIKMQCLDLQIPFGIHIVEPDRDKLMDAIADNAKFIAYGVDGVFLNQACKNPKQQI
jgi:2-dehydro-3-deoxyglucarate aldolase